MITKVQSSLHELTKSFTVEHFLIFEEVFKKFKYDKLR